MNRITTYPVPRRVVRYEIALDLPAPETEGNFYLSVEQHMILGPVHSEDGLRTWESVGWKWEWHSERFQRIDEQQRAGESVTFAGCLMELTESLSQNVAFSAADAESVAQQMVQFVMGATLRIDPPEGEFPVLRG
jgi:hypothetical protein